MAAARVGLTPGWQPPCPPATCRASELEEQREQMAEITAQRQREALDAVALMLPTVREKVEAEERADGSQARRMHRVCRLGGRL